MFDEYGDPAAILLGVVSIIGYLRAKVNDIADRLDRIEDRLEKLEDK